MSRKLLRKKSNDDVAYLIENIPLNRFELEIEAVKQADLMLKAGQLLTNAKDETLKAKNSLELVEFELVKDIQKNPKKYDLEKTTEAVVKLAVKSTDEYQEAFHNFLEKRKQEDEYALLLDNIRQRGHSIKVLAELWLNQYYSDPNNYVSTTRKPYLKKSERENTED